MTWAFDLDLAPTLKLILLVLADHADDFGYCFPGMATISRRASVSERTAIRGINKLEEDGYLERSRRQLENGNRTSNGYRLTPDKVTNRHVTNEGGNVTAVSSTGEPPVEPPVTTTARTRQTQMPNDLMWNNGHSIKAMGKGVDVAVEFEKFKDYHLAHASKFADWDKAFHTWLNNARPDPGMGRGQRTGNPPPRTPTDRMNAVMAIQDPTEQGMIE